MFKKLFTFLIFPALILTTSATSLQAQDTTATVDKSLAGQYREIIQKSKNNDQGFKIVNPARLSSFQRNFADSLRQTRNKLTEAQKQIAGQQKTISTLKADVTGKEQSLAESKSMVDEISMLGIHVNKSTYNWIMWGLVIVLAAALAFIVFQSTSLRKEARYRTNLYSDLAEEFQAFKTKANDKEKKLARELQTEKNRVDELLKR
ncbi:MAG TPA: hypothetical protein VLZ28_02985 [Daejeonella sp.]|nr:hypothetical protein [Daejeonella sp.]